MMSPNTFTMRGGLLVPTSFGYNAVEDRGRRQSPQTRVRHEATISTKQTRDKIQSTAQDQSRNHSLVAWMIRKHLDYVSTFHISFRTGIEPVDTLVNRIFKWHGRPTNFDYNRRFGRDEFFRMFEMEKVLGGDAGIIKMTGLKLQALESDLIAKGTRGKLKDGKDGPKPPTSVNDSGLVVDDDGTVQQYSVCTRGPVGNKVVFHHLEPLANVIFDAYWSRYSSQFRGVSPLTTAINMVQDIHEGLEYNLLKAKMHALFGLAFTRDANGTDGDFGGAGGATAETTSATATATGTTFDLNPRAVNLIDLNPGDGVQVIESGTPSTEFVNGTYLFIQIAMLALDIPVTCFDSRRSNFSARIADLNEYVVSNTSKQTKNRYVRTEYSDWVLEQIWNDSKSPWPLKKVATENKMGLRDVQEQVEWIPAGAPWLDKLKQVQGDQLAIDIGLDNTEDAARRRGANVYENIDKEARVIEYAKAKGVPLVKGKSGERTVAEIVQDEIAKADVNDSPQEERDE